MPGSKSPLNMDVQPFCGKGPHRLLRAGCGGLFWVEGSLTHEDGTDRLSRNVSKEFLSSWNVMTHGDAREGKWRRNWRMEWVASTLYTTSEHGVSSITTADAHTSAATSRLNWRPCLFKWTRPFRRKTKSGFCARAITFQTQSTSCVNNPEERRSLVHRGGSLNSQPNSLNYCVIFIVHAKCTNVSTGAA